MEHKSHLLFGYNVLHTQVDAPSIRGEQNLSSVREEVLVINMLLLGQLVRLLPLNPSDEAELILWAHDPYAHHILALRAISAMFSPLVGDVDAAIADSLTFAITDRQQNRIGFALAYSMNHRDRWLYVDIIAREESPPSLALEAWALLIDFVFAWYPLKLIYREVPDFVPEELKVSHSMGFEDIGTMPKRLWLAGNNWDVSLASLTRERWSHFRQIFETTIAIQLAYESRTQ